MVKNKTLCALMMRNFIIYVTLTLIVGGCVPTGIVKTSSGESIRIPGYLKALKQKINANWSPPDGGREPHEALVTFDILRDGSVRGLQIEQSSGNPSYDEAALSSVLQSNPFPPLPTKYPDETLKIHFSFLTK